MNCTSYDTQPTIRDSRDLILARLHAGAVGALLLPCMPVFLPGELLTLAVTAAAFCETLELPFWDIGFCEIDAAKRPARADDEDEDEDDEDEEDDDEVADEDEDEDDEDEDEDEEDDDEEEEEDEFEESESGFDDDDDDDEEDEDFDDE